MESAVRVQAKYESRPIGRSSRDLPELQIDFVLNLRKEIRNVWTGKTVTYFNPLPCSCGFGDSGHCLS